MRQVHNAAPAGTRVFVKVPYFAFQGLGVIIILGLGPRVYLGFIYIMF